MPDDKVAFEALIDAHANWLGLTIDPAWRPAIRQNLEAFDNAIKAVEAFPLSDEADPAPVFNP
jgi:Protein of unknown function (DUF4089)